MRCRLITCLLVLLAAFPVRAAVVDGALEHQLVRLSATARTLGRTRAAQPVEVVVGLGWRDRVALDALLRGLADPHSPLYGRFLSPTEFSRRFAPRRSQVAAVVRYLRDAGLEVRDVSRSRLLISAVGRADRVERALATALVDVDDAGTRRTVSSGRPSLPAALAARVVAVGAADALHPPQDAAPRAAIGDDAPYDVEQIGRLYEFDALHAAGVRGADTRASTIAIATAFPFAPADLQRFWQEMGVARSLDSVELIPVAGSMATAPAPAVADQLETTLDVEWASAMAPDSRVLVYAGSDALTTTFLGIYDRIVTDNRAAVMTTSWGRCEADYSASYLAQVDAIFARAAAQGITVIAASGDQGAFECGGDTPSVNFPASHPHVLAVGGTSVLATATGFDEIAWSGSGGGASARYDAPPWQMDALPRRVLADVALNADPGSGYLTWHDGRWRVLGGTSVGAPIWAALVSLINQARADGGRAPLGLAAPQLCEAARGSDLAAPFVDIVSGSNRAYDAGAGWDFPTGWGVPRAGALATALASWTPPADARGGLAELIALAPLDADTAGAARLRFERRCLASELTLHVRRFAAGTYTLALDGEAVASFATDARGGAVLTLRGVDVRGQRVTINAGDRVLFASDVEARRSGEQVEARLMNTGMATAATGALVYRTDAGREELTVRTERLPLGTYEVRIAGSTIGSLGVTHATRPVEARFDSRASTGQLLPMSPRCKPILIVRDATAYLRSATDALAPGECGH